VLPFFTPEAPSPRARIRDRASGALVEEPVYREAELRWAYEDAFGRVAFDVLGNNWLFCAFEGLKADLPTSVDRIPAFVEAFGVDMDEAERPIGTYASFNDFFTRRLRPHARPVDPAPGALVSPGDGRLLVFPALAAGARLPIKGARSTLADLLGSAAEAKPFLGGSAAILRLAPQDYHRFHFPARGTAGPARLIPGRYHALDPLALAREPDLHCRNKRAVTVLHTPEFGRIAMVEVGAIAVGTIVQTYRPGRVQRGQEKGYFAYGGSTVVLLFEPEALGFDADLVEDAAAGIEVRVKQGARIALAR
jgi:phosphatidylserine decarboxylase